MFSRACLQALMVLVFTVGAVAAETELPGSAMLALPDAEVPEDGWPTILLLHGYGTNKEDFTAFSGMLVQHGVAAISIDAPVSIGEGRRSWPRDAEQSYAALRPSLDFVQEDKRYDASRVFVGGFSQGGYHSMLMGKGHPSEVAGLLVISPGGGAALPDNWQGGGFEQPLYLLYGEQESDRIRGLVENAAEEWRAAEQRVLVESHDGGHHFPDDWEAVLGRAMDWLLGD